MTTPEHAIVTQALNRKPLTSDFGCYVWCEEVWGPKEQTGYFFWFSSPEQCDSFVKNELPPWLNSLPEDQQVPVIHQGRVYWRGTLEALLKHAGPIEEGLWEACNWPGKDELGCAEADIERQSLLWGLSRTEEDVLTCILSSEFDHLINSEGPTIADAAMDRTPSVGSWGVYAHSYGSCTYGIDHGSFMWFDTEEAQRTFIDDYYYGWACQHLSLEHLCSDDVVTLQDLDLDEYCGTAILWDGRFEELLTSSEDVPRAARLYYRAGRDAPESDDAIPAAEIEAFIDGISGFGDDGEGMALLRNK